MYIDSEVKLDYSDVLLIPRESDLNSRAQVNLEIDHYGTEVVPIIAANMDSVGTFRMAKSLAKNKILTALIKHYSLEELLDFYYDEDSIYSIYSMGITEDDYKKFVEFDKNIVAAGYYRPAAICVDVANGYTRSFESYVRRIADEYPDYVLIVGNVVTADRTEKLIEAGANIVKIGIGPGSVCTTRKVTGIGYPQLSAVLECSAAADAAGGTIIADGGITCPGDAVKAFAAGAGYVMCGGLFAGHDEGMDEPREVPGEYMPFFGMASKEAQDKYNGGVANYRASEGKFVQVPYRGSVNKTVMELLGGIRSACTYLGAESVTELPRRAHFVRVNRQLNNVFGS